MERGDPRTTIHAVRYVSRQQGAYIWMCGAGGLHTHRKNFTSEHIRLSDATILGGPGGEPPPESSSVGTSPTGRSDPRLFSALCRQGYLRLAAASLKLRSERSETQRLHRHPQLPPARPTLLICPEQ